MNIIDLLRIVWRWWWIALVMSVVTLAAATSVFLNAESAYEIAVPLLLEPAANNVDDNAVPVGSVLSGALSGGEVRERITADGGTGLYSVVADDSGVVTITAITDSGQVALATVGLVLEEAPRLLPQVAADYGVSVNDISLQVLTTPGIRGVTEEDLPIAEGSLLVVEAPPPANPYESGDYAAQILTTSLEAALAANQFEIGPAIEILTDQEFRNPAPVIDLLVTGPTEARVIEVAESIEQYLSDQLEELQDSLRVPEARQTRLVALRDVSLAEEVPASPLRATVAVLLLGGIATIATVVAVDAASILRSGGSRVRSVGDLIGMMGSRGRRDDEDEDAAAEAPVAVASTPARRSTTGTPARRGATGAGETESQPARAAVVADPAGVDAALAVLTGAAPAPRTVVADPDPVAEDEPAEEPVAADEPDDEPVAADDADDEPVAEEDPVAEDEPHDEPVAADEPDDETVAADEPDDEPVAADEPDAEPVAADEPVAEDVPDDEPDDEPGAADEPDDDPVAEDEQDDDPDDDEDDPDDRAGDAPVAEDGTDDEGEGRPAARRRSTSRGSSGSRSRETVKR